MRLVSVLTAGAVAAAAVILAGPAAPIRLVDVAAPAGLTLPNTFGGEERETYILESTGNGAAFFDYDGDGANDVLITNGTTLSGGGGPSVQLYHNDGRGKFTDVS